MPACSRFFRFGFLLTQNGARWRRPQKYQQPCHQIYQWNLPNLESSSISLGSVSQLVISRQPRFIHTWRPVWFRLHRLYSLFDVFYMPTTKPYHSSPPLWFSTPPNQADFLVVGSDLSVFFGFDCRVVGVKVDGGRRDGRWGHTPPPLCLASRRYMTEDL